MPSVRSRPDFCLDLYRVPAPGYRWVVDLLMDVGHALVLPFRKGPVFGTLITQQVKKTEPGAADEY